jgi:hypothetical protein
MRRLLIGIVVAAAAALSPTWATAGNQQVAEQIAAALRDSGQLHGYRIGVKYQDGTAWLKGQVATRDEMATAMQLAFNVPGVTRVVNQLTVRSEQPTEPPKDSGRSSVPPRPTDGPSTQTGRSATQPPPVADPMVETTQLEESTAAPVKQAANSRVEKTALEEPALAPHKTNMSVPAPSAKAPSPMPSAYPQPPLPIARANGAAMSQAPMAIPTGAAPARYDQPNVPNYAWPSYAPYPNYAALTYPKQYSPTAWPYIGPFYPYPQVPLGWRKVTLEWHDGWWALDFDDGTAKGPFSGLFRPTKRRY